MADADPPSLLITRWATQAGREPAALSPARARLDARSFSDLLAEAAHLAGRVGFQESDALVRGDWRRILAADSALALALLATIDIDARSEGLRSLLDQARGGAPMEQTELLLRRLIHGLLRLAAALDDWLAPAEEGAGINGSAARHLIAESIGNVLAPQLRALLIDVAVAEAAGLVSEVLPADPASRLRSYWALAAIEEEVLARRRLVEDRWLQQLLDQLAEVAENFIHEIRKISEHAAELLAPDLASGAHSPHVALVMGFAQIFRHAQDRINAVPQRLVDFHQTEVLRAAPRGGIPDSVFLALVPRPDARPVVAKGTLFPAGRDAGGGVIGFAADAALTATGAALARIRRWTPGIGTDGIVSRIDATVFAAGPDGLAGDAIAGIAAAAPSVPVSPAAVFAAPALAVAGALRRIVLTLDCIGLSDAVTPAVLAATMRVSVTTAAGWLDLGAAGVSLDWTRAAGAIAVTIELTADIPPIASCAAQTIDAPADPAIRIALDQDPGDPGLRPWALFGSVGLSGATLDVAVKDLDGLIVSVNGQPASPTVAAPFGILQPEVGGTLRIDHPTLAGRPFDRLLLVLDWASLPSDPHGFGGYYNEYVVGADRVVQDRSPFTNAVFTVTMAAPIAGWPEEQALPLFATADPTAAEPPDIFADEFAPAPVPAPFAPLAPRSWFAVTTSGAITTPPRRYVELTLAGPEQGFGEAVYQANVSHAIKLIAAADAPQPAPGLFKRLAAAIGALFAGIWKAVKAALAATLKTAKAILLWPTKLIRVLDGIGEMEYDPTADPDPVPEPVLIAPIADTPALPNPPYRPLLSGMRLDCARRISDADGALTLHHLLPFEGLGEAVPLAGSPLFAPLPAHATLDIALDGARPDDRQSLLIRLGATDVPITGSPSYAYRAADGWQALPDTAGLTDGTAGFQMTGIVGVTLPGDAAPIAGESDALWLRITLPGAAVPPIIGVTANGLSATRVLGDDVTVLAPVPAGTITKLPGMPGVARVVQPLASIGGRAADDPSALRRNVTERVRHRGRGVTAWDIERLTLDAFPGIARTRVITAGDPAHPAPAAGTVVVVVPAPDSGDAMLDPDRPRTSPQLRGAIATYLGARTSAFAQPSVVDPVYVPVDVSARLAIRGDDDGAIEAAIAALLSPLAEPGLDLADDADEEALRSAIASFLLRRPEVSAIEHLDIALRDTSPAMAWRVPIPGSIEIVAVAAERTALPW